MRALETGRLLLEPLEPAHAAELFAGLSDPALYAFLPGDPPASLAALTARYERLRTRRSPDGREAWLVWVVRLRATGECVATVEVTLNADRRALLAYLVLRPWWRQGLAKEACARVVDHLFAELGAEALIIELDTRNVASIRLAEALGCERVATTVGADHFKGAPSDEHRYERRR